MIGDKADLDRKAARSSRMKSVLPGTGIGISEESMIAKPKSPTGPRFISQCVNDDEDRAPGAGALDEESSNAFNNASEIPGSGARLKLNALHDDRHARARPLDPPVQMLRSSVQCVKTPAESSLPVDVTLRRILPRADLNRSVIAAGA
jgi:hypothetical protein